MQSKTALRSILKTSQSIDDTTTNEGSVPTITTEETAPSESKPVVDSFTAPLESQPAAVDDNSTALLESKSTLNNPLVEEEISNGDIKVLEDVNGRRIVKYVPKPRIRKTQMRAIQKKHNIEDGQLLLKFWKYASVQRQMTSLVTSNFLRSKYSK